MTLIAAIARALGRCFPPVDVGSRAYRPELHYMRGPGPKWHAKRGLPYVPGSRPSPAALDERLVGA
jgi:hypothetical protein